MKKFGNKISLFILFLTSLFGDIYSDIDTFIAKKEFKKAINLYKTILSKYPKNSTIISDFGTLYVLSGNFDEAKKQYLKAII